MKITPHITASITLARTTEHLLLFNFSKLILLSGGFQVKLGLTIVLIMAEQTGPENLDLRWLGAAEALFHLNFKVASKRRRAIQSGHA